VYRSYIEPLGLLGGSVDHLKFQGVHMGASTLREVELISLLHDIRLTNLARKKLQRRRYEQARNEKKNKNKKNITIRIRIRIRGIIPDSQH
jgi:hypothetical protein